MSSMSDVPRFVAYYTGWMEALDNAEKSTTEYECANMNHCFMETGMNSEYRGHFISGWDMSRVHERYMMDTGRASMIASAESYFDKLDKIMEERKNE